MILFHRLEQFNDVVLQDNYLVLPNNDGSIESGFPLFDLSALDFSAKNKSTDLEVLKVCLLSFSSVMVCHCC